MPGAYAGITSRLNHTYTAVSETLEQIYTTISSACATPAANKTLVDLLEFLNFSIGQMTSLSNLITNLLEEA